MDVLNDFKKKIMMTKKQIEKPFHHVKSRNKSPNIIKAIVECVRTHHCIFQTFVLYLQHK